MEQKEPLSSKLSPRLASYEILDGQQTTVTKDEDANAVNANGKKHKCTRLCRLCCCCCCCCSDESEEDEEDDIDVAWQRYQKNVPLILVSSPLNTRPNSNVADYDTFASTLNLKEVLLNSDSSDGSKRFAVFCFDCKFFYLLIIILHKKCSKNIMLMRSWKLIKKHIICTLNTQRVGTAYYSDTYFINMSNGTANKWANSKSEFKK